MIDFRKAIEAGLRNADAADSARNEIEDVLGTLTKAVEAITEGKVTLIRTISDKDLRLPRAIELQSTAAPDRSVLIAAYQISPEGYPAVVTAFGHSLSADDAESLRHIFEAIVERPEMGRHLRALMHDAS